jgi:perosamine synthetase
MSVETATQKTALTETEPFLPFSAPWFGPEEVQEIIAAVESGWITTGPRTKQFEREFAQYVGTEYALAVNSCTAALHLALVALGIGEGDAVATTTFTFSATANVIVHQRAYPILLDVDPDTYNLSVSALRQLLESECVWDAGDRVLRHNKTGARLRAVIAVHYAGHPCQMDEIAQLCRQYGVALVEDAAHALSGRYKGRMVGTLGDVSCFSFYATKNITTSEGGMLATNDAKIAERARIMCLHGISADAWNRYGKGGTWRYDVVEAGFKYNLTDLASALGIHQLRKADKFLERRKEIAAQYQARLADLPIKHPTVLSEVDSAWHLYPVQIASDRLTRDDFIERLKSLNIGTSVHFIPLHRMTYYQNAFEYVPEQFPVADGVFQRIVSLPFFARMTDADVERVIRAVRDVMS